MPWETRWIPLALLLLVACDSNPIAPDDHAPTLNVVSRQQLLVRPASAPALAPPRWLKLRADGLYDDQGRRRLSAERVHTLHIDLAFELHRQAKLEWLKQRGRIGKRESPSGSSSSALVATRNQTLTASGTRLLTVPTGPSFAVAADDPCFFDATVWCSNEYGGELGGGGSGGTSGGDAYGAPTDDGSMDCNFIRSSMANAWAAYAGAQAVYMEMAGSVTDVPFSNGVLEVALQAQYSKMQSYLADYNTWKALAVKYHC